MREMSRSEFKAKHLDNAFFWVNKSNHAQIQQVLQDFEFRCHTGSGLIEWHEGFKNLVTFPADETHDFEYYQKVDFWIEGARYGEPKDIGLMMMDYTNRVLKI